MGMLGLSNGGGNNQGSDPNNTNPTSESGPAQNAQNLVKQAVDAATTEVIQKVKDVQSAMDDVARSAEGLRDGSATFNDAAKSALKLGGAFLFLNALLG